MESYLPDHDRIHGWLLSLPHSDVQLDKCPRSANRFAMPATPPESAASSRQPQADIAAEWPTKKRTREVPQVPLRESADQVQVDHDHTPKVSKTLQHRPILRPTSPSKHAGRRRGRSTSPAKSFRDLYSLEKPVLRSRSEDPPSDVEGLCVDISRVNLNHKKFVPIEVRSEFTALMKRYKRFAEVEESWFTTPLDVDQDEAGRRKQRALEEMGRLLDVIREADESYSRRRHEAHWNSAVHHPLLTLAFGSGLERTSETAANDTTMEHHRIFVENVTSATITGDCVPQLKQGRPRAARNGAVTNAPIPAWSLSEATTDSSSTNNSVEDLSQPDESDPFSESQITSPRLDGAVHTKTGSKKVDFALVLVPSPGTSLHTAIQTVLVQLKQTSPELSQSINPSTYSPLVTDPIAVVIETKTVTTGTDPLVQLGMMAAAIHRRLHTLPVQNATGSQPVTDTGMIMTLPLISVNDHQWEIYFACDGGKDIQIYGPIELGTTKTLMSSYMLLTNLRLLGRWIQDVFYVALESWLQGGSV
ncbi:hypothetical protein F5883DRAFT_722555 [Diaporthe sp. PMI_573]|nr:hypothetical protein F5883DRAFT_722555 [Diaporthaceae sp. PMI_573]